MYRCLRFRLTRRDVRWKVRVRVCEKTKIAQRQSNVAEHEYDDNNDNDHDDNANNYHKLVDSRPFSITIRWNTYIRLHLVLIYWEATIECHVLFQHGSSLDFWLQSYIFSSRLMVALYRRRNINLTNAKDAPTSKPQSIVHQRPHLRPPTSVWDKCLLS